MHSLIHKTLPGLAVLGLILTGCQPDLEAPEAATRGTADFSRYIAVGNSLTAGFSDNGLYLEGQQNSYPSILAQQFKAAGGGDFVQPLFPDANSNGSGYLRLTGFDANGSPVTAQVPGNAGRNPGAPGSAPYVRFEQPINNLGVPGIRMSDVQTAGYGSTLGNPYFERITPNTTPTAPFETYFQRVKREAANATFFTSWLGNNDVLGYATAGGASSTTTTNVDTFRLKSNRIINALTANGAKGVIATIPDVTGIPFFTTVGPRLKATLLSRSVAGLVVMTGAAPGGPATANRKVVPTADIRDASGGRQLFTLTGAGSVGFIGAPTGKPWRDLYRAGGGSGPAGLAALLNAYGVDTTAAFGVTPQNPFPSAFVLDDVEQGNITTALTSYNNTLRTQAAAKNLALFDANGFFSSVVQNRYATDAVVNSTSFITGNIFSLDGVHPTPRGYAIIANEMIKVINAKYGSTIQPVNANNYRGVRFP
ncbi:SGNH/GDSL hydrolase family protein [Hymenobacter sp. BT175]|uniref:SGNH/GDSL hydrolase family protein n=1 Tax=Hymenobacter translucens TaxID=2886507 RepID=UPI001D0EC740|nr:SGNH/GDSL hydrolase family protein [Hymenobacter translucens]MCC2545993.1 SGNH/GDSL hydrolase family protein [Hymenobacter translucens]